MRRPNQKVATSCGFIGVLWMVIITWLIFLVGVWYSGQFAKPSKPIAPLSDLSIKALHTEVPLPISGLPVAGSSSSIVEPNRKEQLMHIVFSTDCSFFQDWQTLLVFHSAVNIKQSGRITRIASGCSEDRQKELKDLYAKLYPQYDVHFTPDYKKDGKTKKKYDFYNKPFGLKHWLENGDHLEHNANQEVIIALIDPDFIFLRPLTLNIKGNPSIIYMKKYDPAKNSAEIPDTVTRGHPAAQLYGLGAPWAYDNHHNFNRTEVCGVGSPCLKVKALFGEQHYSVGPPYLVEMEDMKRLTNAWTEFVPLVYSKYPELLAEMYAYSMAAAHTNLPHITVINHMVSNTDMGDDEEGWKYIDALGDATCQPPVESGSVKMMLYPDRLMPTFLHHCQFFRAGEIGFQKRRFPKSMFQCNSPLLLDLPVDLGKVDYKNRDGEKIKIGPRNARRNSFMLCAIHRYINAMLIDYKTSMCPAGDINLEKSINIVKLKY